MEFCIVRTCSWITCLSGATANFKSFFEYEFQQNSACFSKTELPGNQKYSVRSGWNLWCVQKICGCTEKWNPKELHLSQTLEGCVVGCFLGCLLVFYSPQMSNNFLCEQVGAANFVAPWSTSKKTARRNRMQVSCRGCGLGVGPAVVSYCSA